MSYNVRKWNPFLIGIPDIGIGMYWVSLGNVVVFYAYRYTTSAVEIAKIFSIAALVGVFTQLIIGNFSDQTVHRWGRRTPWIVYGMIFAGISQMLWIFVPSFTLFLIVSGLTFTLVNVAQCAYYTMVMEVVDKDQIGFSNTIARTVACFGGLLMSIISTYIWDEKIPIITFFIMAMIMILPTIFIVPTIVKERSENYTKTEKFTLTFDFLKNKNIIILFLGTFFIFSAYTGIINMGAPLFVKSFQFSEKVYSQGMMALTFANLIYGFFAFRIVDYFNKKFILTLFLFVLSFVCGLSFVFLKVGSHSIFLWIFMFVYGFSWLAVNISLYTVLSMISPKEKLGEFMGWLNLFIALPQFICANLIGACPEIICSPYEKELKNKLCYKKQNNFSL